MSNKRLKWYDMVWGGSALVLIGFEIYEIRRAHFEGTLSHFARRVFRTDTLIGKAVFLSSWYGFSAWLGYHIALEKKDNGNAARVRDLCKAG